MHLGIQGLSVDSHVHHFDRGETRGSAWLEQGRSDLFIAPCRGEQVICGSRSGFMQSETGARANSMEYGTVVLGGQFKSGQLESDQNRPTEVARNC